MTIKKRTISVIGLGYVGLPVAIAFGEAGFKVVGFDVNNKRIEELKNGYDQTFEVENVRILNQKIEYTDKSQDIKAADFHIITVPTPVSDKLEPDISFLTAASEIVGARLKRGDVIVYESTVYPGCTEEDCIPILETASGLKSGTDFFVGYSPERINPGDKSHRFETIMKVVSGQCEHALEAIAQTYAAVVKPGIYKAPSIKVAEAAKVIENTQRDLNIAFVNELSKIFKKIDIDTFDVLEAASTKWNFNLFEPGLVGGHCIGVDPYYLTAKANRVGAQPEVILAGRKTNNEYAHFIAEQCKSWCDVKNIKNPRVALLGLTFKENVPDTRNSKAFDLLSALNQLCSDLSIFEPLASLNADELNLPLNPRDANNTFNVIILAVPHDIFVEQGWAFVSELAYLEQPVLVMDIKARLDRSSIPSNIDLWRP